MTVRLLDLIGLLQNGTRECAEMVCYLTSFERVSEYAAIKKEDVDHKISKKSLKNWPSNGEILFSNVNFKYKNNNCYLLKDINFKINAGDKVSFHFIFKRATV